MSTQEIYNYHKVDDRVITGGQPTEAQLRSAAGEGYKIVINLATEHPQHSPEDEASMVRSLGMAYYHIPVEWDNPTPGDFQAFENLLLGLGQEKILIHCMANFRVTAFYSLYAMKYLGWSQDRAEEFRLQVWRGSDYPVWEKFIRQVEAEISQSSG